MTVISWSLNVVRVPNKITFCAIANPDYIILGSMKSSDIRWSSKKMNAYANADLRMPAHYTDMSEKEMEYDGGFGILGSCLLLGISIGSRIIANTTKNETVRTIACVVGTASAVLSVGTLIGGVYAAATCASFGVVGGFGLVCDVCSFGVGMTLTCTGH